mmetsp:Transcript_2763/g.9881  ORF Transcript_2763/g.9881 Transcript_2763/m.9881 type:complete len:219 (-) Transcript_2763:1815-2471(-)
MRIFLCAFLLALFPVAVVVVRNVVVSHLKLLLLHLQVLHLLLILLKLEVITVCVCVVVFIIFIIIRVPIIVHSHTSETYVRVVIHTSFVEISTLLAGTVPTSVAVVIVVVIIIRFFFRHDNVRGKAHRVFSNEESTVVVVVVVVFLFCHSLDGVSAFHFRRSRASTRVAFVTGPRTRFCTAFVVGFLLFLRASSIREHCHDVPPRFFRAKRHRRLAIL